jgi:hypothetical protein
LTTHPISRRGYRKSRAIPLLPIWPFVACYRANFTFYLAPRILSWLLNFWKICTSLYRGVILVSECPIRMCSTPDDVTSLVHCAVTSRLCSCCQQSCARLPVRRGSRNLPRVLPSILRSTAAGQAVLVAPGARLHATLSGRLQGLPYRRSAPFPTVDSFSG